MVTASFQARYARQAVLPPATSAEIISISITNIMKLLTNLYSLYCIRGGILIHLYANGSVNM
ncbi:hypothetical protein Hanom_Chr12g01156761 [Helianthus anomalus]